MKVQGSVEGDDVKATPTVVGLLLSLVVGTLLFVPLWAGLNFAFGSALDGPIGAIIMEAPCQRLAHTTEPLSRYTLGKGRVHVSSSVCHFASGRVRVADGRTDGLGFTERELAYLLVGFAGYAVCFGGALVLTVSVIRGGRRFFALLRSKRRARSDSRRSH